MAKRIECRSKDGELLDTNLQQALNTLSFVTVVLGSLALRHEEYMVQPQAAQGHEGQTSKATNLSTKCKQAAKRKTVAANALNPTPR
eukprot:3000944-Amphidinium_carterae.2